MDYPPTHDKSKRQDATNDLDWLFDGDDAPEAVDDTDPVTVAWNSTYNDNLLATAQGIMKGLGL